MVIMTFNIINLRGGKMTAEKRARKICDCNIHLGSELGYQMVLNHLKQYAREMCEPYREAMQEFVDRVDKGEIRSIKTYTKFKELLREEK